MACEISKDIRNNVMMVYTDTKKESKLWLDIIDNLKNRFGNSKSEQEIKNQAYSQYYTRTKTPSFQRWFSSLNEEDKVDTNGEPKIEYVLTPTELSSKVSVKEAPILPSKALVNRVTDDAERLMKKMNIPYEFDNTINGLGEFRKGKVLLNPERLSSDTAFHEFSHPFVEAIRRSNPMLFNNLSRRASQFMTVGGTNIYDHVKANYPYLTPNSSEFMSEVITTAIGIEGSHPESIIDKNKFAAWINTVFKAIGDYINSLIDDPNKKIRPEDLSVNMTINDLAELMRLDNEVDLSSLKGDTDSQFTLPQELRVSAAPQFDYIADLKKKLQTENIRLNDSNRDDSYYEKFGKRYERLTNWVHTNISAIKSRLKDSSGNTITLEQSIADQRFRFKDKATDTINYKGEDLTYDKFISKLKYEFDVAKYKGKIIHAYIERYTLLQNGEDTTEVENNLKTYYSESAIDPAQFRYLSDDYIKNLLVNKLGINPSGPLADKIAPELTIVSDIFGLGTTLDGLIQHADGSISITDFKTGAAFLNDDESNTNFIDYGIRNDVEIKDTKLGRAKIELAMRAMILKELYPDIKIRDVKLAYLSYKMSDTKIFDINLDGHINWADDYFSNMPQRLDGLGKKEKDEAKKKQFYNKAEAFREISKQGNKKSIFNEKSYGASSKTLFEDEELRDYDAKNLTIDQKIERIGNLLQQYVAYRDTNPDMKRDAPTDYANLGKKIENLRAIYTELNSGTKNLEVKSADTGDIGWLKRHLGNLYHIKNPLVQQVIKKMVQGQQVVIRKATIKKEKIEHLTGQLVKEYYQKTGKSNILGQNANLSQKDLWSFMHEEREEVVGYDETDNSPIKVKSLFRKIWTEQDLKDGKITKTQYAISQEIEGTIEEMAKALEKPTIMANGKNGDVVLKSRAEYEGIDMKHFRKSFMPRVFKTDSEFYEDNGIKDILKSKWHNYMNEFFLSESVNNNPNLIPIKYKESANAAANADKLSTRWNHLIMQSYNNIMTVDELGSSLAYSKTVQDFLQYDKSMLDEHGTMKFKQSRDWLQSFTKMQLLSDRDRIEYTGGKSYVNKRIIKKLLGEERYKRFNFDRMVDSLNSLVTMTTMWFKPVSGVFNGFLNLLLTSQKGFVNTIAKRGFGVETNEFEGADFIKANAQYLQSNMFSKTFQDAFGTHKEGNTRDKVKFFLEYFGFDSNKFSYVVSTTDLNDAKMKIVGSKTPFVFFQVGEEYSQVTLLLAQLNAMKTKDKDGKEISMFDAYSYDEEAKSFKYTGQERFKTKDGRSIGEPSFEEITKMKRTYERIHGGYKTEEKMAIEAVAIGRWLVKFRKYLPSQIFENTQSNYEDWSIGDWGNTVNEKGEPVLLPGETTVEWISRNNEGRIRLFTKWLIYSKGLLGGDPRYQWKNLSDFQKKQVISMAVNVSYGLLVVVGAMAMFGNPDDDKDKKKLANTSIFRRAMRLKEDMMPLNPLAFTTGALGSIYGTNPVGDLLRTTASPLLQSKQVYDLSQASWNFMVNGVILDQRLKTGKNKGKLVGSTQLEKNLPIASVFDQMSTFSYDMKTLAHSVLTPEEHKSLIGRESEITDASNR